MNKQLLKKFISETLLATKISLKKGLSPLLSTLEVGDVVDDGKNRFTLVSCGNAGIVHIVFAVDEQGKSMIPFGRPIKFDQINGGRQLTYNDMLFHEFECEGEPTVGSEIVWTYPDWRKEDRKEIMIQKRGTITKILQYGEMKARKAEPNMGEDGKMEKKSGYCVLFEPISPQNLLIDDLKKNSYIPEHEPCMILKPEYIQKNTNPSNAIDKKALKGINKKHLIAYVCMINGPLSKDVALAQVCALQGVGFVKGSNFSYFDNSTGMPGEGLLMGARDGRKMVYTTTDSGEALAKIVIDRVGEEPAKSVANVTG